MKKLAKFGMAAFVLPVLFSLIGCAALGQILMGGDSNTPPPSMVFKDAANARQLTIDGRFNIEVLFLDASPFVAIPNNNDHIKGRINDPQPYVWNSNFSGQTSGMSSNNNSVNGTLLAAGGLPVKFTYTKSGNNVRSVRIEFPAPEGATALKLAAWAFVNEAVSGTYNRVNN